jgi:hypothetical protein
MRLLKSGEFSDGRRRGEMSKDPTGFLGIAGGGPLGSGGGGMIGSDGIEDETCCDKSPIGVGENVGTP